VLIHALADLDIGLSPEAHRALIGRLRMVGSLPFVRPDVDLTALDEPTLRALAQAVDALQVALSRRRPEAFVQYAFRHEENDADLCNAPHHEAWHRFFDAHDRAILFAPVEHAKAVPLTTEIPTPNGFRQMGDIAPGDIVYDAFGRPTTVVACSTIQRREVYEITTDDGEKVRACGEHQWWIWNDDDLCAGRPPRTVTTDTIRASVKRSGRYFWRIPTARAVEYPSKALPVAPYVLGAWLGDGEAKTSMLTYHVDDRYVADRCVELEGGIAGAEHSHSGREHVKKRAIGTSIRHKRDPNALPKRLRALGVLRNQHIPEEYKQASIEQRRELLAGLMDTDGTIDGQKGRSVCSFSNKNERLARDVAELARSLGFKVSLVRLNAKGYIYFQVRFTAREPVFKLPRKLAKQKLDGDRRRTRHRTIVSVEACGATDVKCIAVDAPTNTYLMGRAYCVTHNSQHIALGRTIYKLGQNPNKRFAVISNTAEPHAIKLLGSIRKHIASNPRVRRVFPELKPSTTKGDPWGQTQITVERDTIAKDPSVQSLGVYGPINGSRLDGIILDDVLNFENTRTKEQIKKLISWLDSEVFTRVVEGGWVHWIGTPWNPADPMHAVASRKGWTSRRYSGVENPDDPIDLWRPLWPEQFSPDRLRKIYEGTTPINFARKYLCRVRMDHDSRFQQAWIDTAIEHGRGLRLERRQPTSPNGTLLPCYTGVDLGVGQKEGHDLTVLFTICIDHRNKKRIVDIQAGRFPAPEIIQRIHDVSYRFNSLIYVESNAAQDFLRQWAGAEGLPVRAFTTTAGKKFDERFGVESIAVEMRGGQWAIPSGQPGEGLHPEIDEWIREMLFYDPAAHTGDRLMASWFAREAARAGRGAVYGLVDTLAR
jgi:hypothetical protein